MAPLPAAATRLVLVAVPEGVPLVDMVHAPRLSLPDARVCARAHTLFASCLRQSRTTQAPPPPTDEETHLTAGLLQALYQLARDIDQGGACPARSPYRVPAHSAHVRALRAFSQRSPSSTLGSRLVLGPVRVCRRGVRRRGRRSVAAAAAAQEAAVAAAVLAAASQATAAHRRRACERRWRGYKALPYPAPFPFGPAQLTFPANRASGGARRWRWTNPQARSSPSSPCGRKGSSLASSLSRPRSVAPPSLARLPPWPHRAHPASRARHTGQTPERATVDAMRQVLTNVAGDFGSLCGAGLEPLRPSMRAYRNGTDAEVCPRTTRKKTTSGKRRGKERVKKGKRKGKERERTTSGKRRGKDNERVGLSATVLFSLLLNAASLN